MKFFVIGMLVFQYGFSMLSDLESEASRYVGELGDKWLFPSDHLPVGASVGPLSVTSWNILNTKFLHHIASNDQGLLNSSIIGYDIPFGDESSLTFRENNVVMNIISMVVDDIHFPRNVVAIQECNNSVLDALRKRFPDNIDISTPFDGGLRDDNGEAIIYNSSLFEYIGSNTYVYQAKRGNSIFDVTLRERKSGDIYRIINSHVPGGPYSIKALDEFGDYLISNYDDKHVMIVMGDLNASYSAIAKVLSVKGIDQQYRYVESGYPSHIDTRRNAVTFDHIFVSVGKNSNITYKSKDAYEVLHGLGGIVDLLKKS